MNTDTQVLTLEDCREFINKNLHTDDYVKLAELCQFPPSTVKKYIKEGSPLTAAAKILSIRIVVHAIEIIKKKATSKIDELEKLTSEFELPTL